MARPSLKAARRALTFFQPSDFFGRFTCCRFMETLINDDCYSLAKREGFLSGDALKIRRALKP